jgi:anaerobic dimethyl sulfoxide reductase subunit A
MIAILHVLLSDGSAEGLARREWAAARSVGIDQLAAYVLGRGDGISRGPEWAESICGIPAAEIRRLATLWATTRPAMLLPGFSIQRVRGGEEPYRLAVALQLASGNFGLAGGSTGSLNNRLPTPRVGHIDPLDLVGRPEVPLSHWPDAILRGRGGGFPTDIKAAFVAGANWLGQGVDARKSAAALDSLEFSVCLELFPTPTALRCDVVLPVASPLEKEDIGLPWLGNWLTFKPRAVAPAGLCRSDYEILSDLAARMGFESAFTENRSAAEWIEHFIEQSEIGDPEKFRRRGVYIAPDQERVGLADFAADPKGHPLGTPSGRVELASAAWARDSGDGEIPTWKEPEEDKDLPLLLVSPKVAHRTHSQGGDPESVARSGGHFIEINPIDAAVRDVFEGDVIRLSNSRGATRAPARVTDRIRPGVVSLAEGIWLPANTEDYEGSGSANLLFATHDHGPARAVSMHAVRVQAERA